MQRRMVLYKMERLEDYAQYLLDHPAEVKALYEEILIHVTSFFRDLEAFERLKSTFSLRLPTINPQSSDSDFGGGITTGEEVYSIAMCLLEFLGDRVINRRFRFLPRILAELRSAKPGLVSTWKTRC